ncbi:MAG: proteasome subunit beta, partial [Infirmifilum sp.]
RENFTATGSGSPYAVAMLDQDYREDLSLEDAVKLAIRAVHTALARDPGSGEGVDVATITEEGITFKRT